MLSSGFYITAELKIKDKDRILETREALQALCKLTLQQELDVAYFNCINANKSQLVYYFGNASTQNRLTMRILNSPIHNTTFPKI
jgi:hypothetical protein